MVNRIENATILINGQNMSEYRWHPRMLELRIIVVFNILARAYGINEATNYFKTLCHLFRIDWARISAIVNSAFAVRKMEKAQKKRFRQEVIFMGLVWGESKFYIAKYYLKISHVTLYKDESELDPHVYLTQKWLEELPNSVVICGHDTYKMEAMRFVESYHNFLEVMGHVSLSKTPTTI